MLAACAAQSGFSTIYQFTGSGGDGADPNGILAIGANGALYGTTTHGGSASCNCGTVFELDPPAAPGDPWKETVLYRFNAESGDGSMPYGGVIIGMEGKLYGTTLYAGVQGYGNVFEMTPPQSPGGNWTEKVIYSFLGRAWPGT